MAGKENGKSSPKKGREQKETVEQKQNKKSLTKSVKEESKTSEEPSPSTSITSSFFWIPALISLLSLAAGILTPPLLTFRNESHPLGGSNVVQKWVASLMEPSFPNCNDRDLSNFLHDKPVEGLHVVCLAQRDKNQMEVKLFPGASNEEDAIKHVMIDPPSEKKQVSWNKIHRTLRNELDLSVQDELHQPWAIFTPIGERLVEEDEALHDLQKSSVILNKLLESGMVLLFEGGQWQWPGVRVGFQRSVDLYSIMPGEAPESATTVNKTRTVTLETINLEPLVLSVEGFLAPFESDHIVEVASPDMEYSHVKLMDHDQGKDSKEFRTSQSAFVAGQDDIFLDLEYRTASLVRIPKNHQEDLQVLRYGLNEHYVGHHDFFDPAYYSQDEGTLKMIQYGRKNRLATVFWYLSDVAAGGETAFPNAAGMESETACEDGLKVTPQRGKVIIFYSLLPSGEMDDLSLHAACPVKEGIKWAANKWVWNGVLTDDDDNGEEDEYDQNYYGQGEYTTVNARGEEVDDDDDADDDDAYWDYEDEEEAWEQEQAAEPDVDVRDA